MCEKGETGPLEPIDDREDGNKEGSAKVAVGMLLKADKGDGYRDKIDRVETGDDDTLW